MKRATGLVVFILGLLPSFFVYSAETAPWIAPEVDTVDYWYTSSTNKGSDAEAVCRSASNAPSQANIDYFQLELRVNDVNETLKTCQWIRPSQQVYAEYNLLHMFYDIPVCKDPNYQDGVDSNDDGDIDRCYPSNCPTLDFVWSANDAISAPTGDICVNQPNASGGSKSCKYRASKNPDGSNSHYNFSPTGEGCKCEESELFPCVDGQDGGLTDTPPPEGCAVVADQIYCQANEAERCPNGICDEGCGTVNGVFMYPESDAPPDIAEPCKAGDTRPSCTDKVPGDCPEGVINCQSEEDEDEPEAPCVENDTRPSCAGVPVGDDPKKDTSNRGIEERLDLANKNLKDIRSDTKKIADELTKKLEIPDGMEPDDNSDWQDVVTKVQTATSGSDINADEISFKNSFSNQESAFTGQVNSIIPVGGSCSSISIVMPKGTGVIDACGTLTQIRTVIEWAMILLLALYIRYAFMRLKPNGA